VLCVAVGGLAPGPRLAALRREYTTLVDGMSALPVPLPWTRYGKALRALDAILATLAEVVAEHRDRPTGDGLSRLLAARGPDGEQFTDAEARLELHHIVVAGFIVHGLLGNLIVQLTAQPELQARLRTAVRQAAPAGPLTPEQLARLPELLDVVLEVKRVTPILPAVFGEALRVFEFAGYTIPAGQRVGVGVYASNLDSTIYSAPTRFDPARFAPPRAEQTRHPYAFAPQGAGEAATTHRCAGLDFTTNFLLVFAVLLLRDYAWELPPQDLAPRWNASPAVPRSGLHLRLRPLAPG
jgi:cytochrome P450